MTTDTNRENVIAAERDRFRDALRRIGERHTPVEVCLSCEVVTNYCGCGGWGDTVTVCNLCCVCDSGPRRTVTCREAHAHSAGEAVCPTAAEIQASLT